MAGGARREAARAGHRTLRAHVAAKQATQWASGEREGNTKWPWPLPGDGRLLCRDSRMPTRIAPAFHACRTMRHPGSRFRASIIGSAARYLWRRHALV